MKKILTVYEYQPIKIGEQLSIENKVITQSQANIIKRIEKSQKRMFKWGDEQLIPQQYIGYIEIPGLQIEILPKLDKLERGREVKIRDNMHFMLEKAKEVPYRDVDLASLSTNRGTILECYISVFVRNLIDAIKKGVIHQYVSIQRNEAFLKGKLLIPEQMRRNFIHKERFFITYDEFSNDNMVNRALKATIIKLLDISKSVENLKRLQLLKDYFIDINEHGFRVTDFNKMHVSRMHQEYKKIIDMAKVFWQDELPTNLAGNNKIFSLLFDMNVIFEKFIRNVLIENQSLILSDSYYVAKRKQQRFLLYNQNERGVFSLIPDIIIRNRSSNINKVIVDTKWKHLDFSKENIGISEKDIYQMYVYAREFDCREIILLYPEFRLSDKSLPVYTNHTMSSKDITIRICTIDLAYPMSNQVNKIIEQLKFIFQLDL